MSDRRKKWSIGRFAGDIGGGAVTGAAGAATKAILIPDPSGTSQILTIAVCAAGGAVVGGVGSVWGYFTDDSFQMEFRSALLFNSVIGTAIAVPFVLIGSLIEGGRWITDTYVLTVVGFSAFVTAAGSYLLDDRRARHERREWERERDYAP